MRKIFVWLLVVIVLTGTVLVWQLPRYAADRAERRLAETIGSFGLVPDVQAHLAYRWRGGPRLEGRLRVAVLDSPWHVTARLEATPRGWSATARMPETAFDQDDPTLAFLHRKYPTPTVSNLTFSGTIALDAEARGGYLWSPPQWKVKVPVRNVRAKLFLKNNALALDALSLTPALEGTAAHADIKPLFLRARSLNLDDIAFTNLNASVLASERALLVNEANAGFCGGKVSLYSLFLDMKSLYAGVTLFAEDIDAGRALRHFNGFAGDATGRLHGKIRLTLRDAGRAIRLHDAFLYSTPGETGKLLLENTTALTDYLTYAGLDEATRANVAEALKDLDYTALKLTLRRTGERNATMTTHINGTAARDKLTIPVNLTLNFHGDIEQILNLGIDYSNKLKGKNRK